MTSNTRKRSTEDQGFDTAFRSDFGDSHRRYPTPAIGNSGRQIKRARREDLSSPSITYTPHLHLQTHPLIHENHDHLSIPYSHTPEAAPTFHNIARAQFAPTSPSSSTRCDPSSSSPLPLELDSASSPQTRNTQPSSSSDYLMECDIAMSALDLAETSMSQDHKSSEPPNNRRASQSQTQRPYIYRKLRWASSSDSSPSRIRHESVYIHPNFPAQTHGGSISSQAGRRGMMFSHRSTHSDQQVCQSQDSPDEDITMSPQYSSSHESQDNSRGNSATSASAPLSSPISTCPNSTQYQ